MTAFATLRRTTLFLIAIALLGLFSMPFTTASHAADEQAAPVAPVTPAINADEESDVKVDAKQVEQWVADLDSDEFQARENATDKLIKAGAPAVPAVEKATSSKSFEQSSRAMRILDQMARSKKDADMLAANAALARLSKSDDETVAKQAKDAIESAKPKAPAQNPNNRIIQLPGGGKIQIQIQNGAIIQGIGGAGNVNATSISKSNVNGVETTDVSEASGRRIKILKDKTIKITVTEKVKGKDETKTYEADDEEALKKKHPDAHKIFEKYGKDNGIPNIRAFGIQRGNIFPVPANRAGQALPNRRAMQKSAAEAQAKLEKVIEQLDASKKAGDKADLDALRSQVEEAIKDLKEAQGKK